MRATTPEERAALHALGRRIRAFRERMEMTIAELARCVDCDASYLGQLERGTRNPTVLLLVRLGGALRVSPAALLSNDATDLDRSMR